MRTLTEREMESVAGGLRLPPEGIPKPGQSRHDALRDNDKYAAAMARMQYARFTDPLPEAGDIQGQAEYWKQYYNRGSNTPANGTTEQYVDDVEPILCG